ncbi:MULTISPECIES: hypothetical protein [unclassified Streptomyces]
MSFGEERALPGADAAPVRLASAEPETLGKLHSGWFTGPASNDCVAARQ